MKIFLIATLILTTILLAFQFFDSSSSFAPQNPSNLPKEQTLDQKLESDLARMKNIEHASIIFDLQSNEGSASVILTLTPKSTLAKQQLRSIIYHVASAHEKFKPQNISVSDTTGKLYHAMGSSDLTSKESMEEQIILTKVNQTAAALLGNDQFFADVSLISDRDNLKNIHISMTIDQDVLQQENNIGVWTKKNLRDEIEKQLTSALEGISGMLTSNISFVPFNKQPKIALNQSEITEERNPQTAMWTLFAVIFLQGSFSLVFLYRWKSSRIENKNTVEAAKAWCEYRGEPDFIKKTHEPETMAAALADQEADATRILDMSAQKIALIMYFIDPKRSAQILVRLTEQKQVEIFKCLSELGTYDEEALYVMMSATAKMLGKSQCDVKLSADDGVKKAAMIFQELDSKKQKETIESLGNNSPKLVSSMITFIEVDSKKTKIHV